MNVAKLAERQLFLMKAENLEKRVRAYYAQTQDVDSLIEYGVAILVRSFFCMGSFSELIQDLIQEVYFTVEPTAVMRQYLPYFEDYFTENEWQTIVNRLFGNHTTYLAQTEEARVNKGYLEQTGTLDNRIEGLVYRVEAVFEDTIGKKHKLTIRDTDSTFNEAQTIQVLNILTTLSIFDTADVRKYETYVSYQTPGKIIATSHNSRQKTKPTAKESENIAAEQPPEKEKTVAATNKKQSSASVSTLPKEASKQTASSNNTSLKKNTTLKKNQSSPTSLPKNTNTSDSPSPNPELKKKASGNKANELLDQPDTSYKRLGKNEEQIQSNRDGRKMKNRVNNALGRSKNRKRNKRK
ncbi:hypothetical protein ACWOE8_10545 [Enterococcus avium]